jgi:hypothetical protein
MREGCSAAQHTHDIAVLLLVVSLFLLFFVFFGEKYCFRSLLYRSSSCHVVAMRHQLHQQPAT